MRLTGRERALRALQFLPVDRVALMGGEIESSYKLRELSGQDYWKAPSQVDVIIEACRDLGIDLLINLLQPFSPDMELRAWDIKAIFRYARQRYPDIESVIARINAFPTPEQLRKTYDQQGAYMIHLTEQRENDRASGEDLLWLASNFTAGCCKFMWYLDFGYVNYFTLLADHKEAAHKLFRYSAEAGRLQNQAIAAAIQENDLPPFIYIGEDLCYNSGLMVSPRLLDQIYFPWLAYALEPLVQAGIGIIWHCDGNVMPIIERLLKMGVAGFQGFQEDVGVDLGWIARKQTIQGHRPILMGSVQARSSLPFGTEEDVRRDVERCLRIVGLGSGFFIGPSAVVQPEVPIENVRAMYDHARRVGRLPFSPWGANV
jgi:hypothetical protein